MKRIDGSPHGIFETTWSQDGKWVAYVMGTPEGEGEIRLTNVENAEIRIIGQGKSPGVADDYSVVFEREDEIYLARGSGVDMLLGKKDIVKDAPKRNPVVSPDGKLAVVVVCNVFSKVSQSKNAFPYRHFLAMMPLDGSKSILLDEQWYGGTMVWFPDSSRFAHFEFDSTAGPQVHIISRNGKREGNVAGMYPSVSPDGTRLAVRPRNGGSLVIYSSKGTWNDHDVDMNVIRIPESETTRSAATPPIWLDNRLVIAEEGGKVWRLDTKQDKAEVMKKIPLPTERRTSTMVASPQRDQVALEVSSDEGYELRILSL